MIKQLLKKCAELINRDDILDSLKTTDSVDDISNTTIQNDIIRLISYFNFVVSNIFENYINLTETESLVSDENNRIYFSLFKKKPIKIISVKNPSNTNTHYSLHASFINTNSPNTEFNVTYNFVPSEAKDLNDEFEIPYNLNTKIICYGIVSEFLASKDQFEKSEFWKNKFLYEIFKLKTKKERRLKSTFNR